jgi:hypothetical protein
MSDVLVRSGTPDFGAIDAIIHARHGDPFAVLGPHECADGCAVRSFQPGATAVEAIAADSDRVLAKLESIDPAGFWSGVMPAWMPYRLRVTARDAVRVTEDPYAFGPSLGEVDIYLLAGASPPAMPPLGEEVDIDLAQGWPEGIGVFRHPHGIARSAARWARIS